VERFRAAYLAVDQGEPSRGRDTVARRLRELRAVDEDARFQPDRLVVVGDKVVVTFRHETASEAVHVWTVREGQALQVEVFDGLDSALAALDLAVADAEALAAALATPR
jgi:ketosteroid isomerase-like protein